MPRPAHALGLLLLVSCAHTTGGAASRAPETPAHEVEDATPPHEAGGAATNPSSEPHAADEPAPVDGPAPYRDLGLVTDPPGTEYNRDDWNHWIDADGDCQDTRAEILIAQSKEPVKFATSKECRVVSGLWVDPYTGETFTEAKRLDIDHIVTLKDAHDSGGWKWTAEQREAFANEPENLLAVSASANRSKGARDPAEWMPPAEEYACTYAILWVYLKHYFHLGADEPERLALGRILDSCPSPGGIGIETHPDGSRTIGGTPLDPPTNPEPPARECCRVCRTSQPCGDSCISKEKTCRKSAGCAC